MLESSVALVVTNARVDYPLSVYMVGGLGLMKFIGRLVLYVLFCLSCPFLVADDAESYLTVANSSLNVMYGKGDIGGATLFGGGYINWGYWDGIPLDRSLTMVDRILSQRNLYLRLLKECNRSDVAVVAEVGCGRGAGAILAWELLKPQRLVGIDQSQDQIDRARECIPNNIELAVAPGDQLPLKQSSVDLVYSVEVFQHMARLRPFFQEVHRVLSPGGRFAFVCFFGTSRNSHYLLANEIETIRSNVDHIHSIASVIDELQEEGLILDKVESIGASVFPGYDQWMGEIEGVPAWGRNWLKAYRMGYIDYFVVVAHKQSFSRGD